MKNLLLIILLPLSFLFLKNDKISTLEENDFKVTSCRIEKIYLDDAPFKEYYFDDDNNLIKINWIKNDEISAIHTIEYDDKNKMINYDCSLTSHGARINVREENYIYHRYKNYFEYNKELIKESKSCTGHFSMNGVKDKELNCDRKSKYIYDSHNRLIEIEDKPKKKVFLRAKRKKYLTTFQYDENENPIRIQTYIISGKNDSLLISRIDRKYDSMPNLQYNCSTKYYYPVIVKNNILYEKIVIFDDHPKMQHEYKYIYEYDENGLVTKLIKETVDSWIKDRIGNSFIFTYEYKCD